MHTWLARYSLWTTLWSRLLRTQLPAQVNHNEASLSSCVHERWWMYTSVLLRMSVARSQNVSTHVHVFFLQARRYASAVIAVIACPSVCPFVCPSDTSPSCTNTAKRRITQTMPHGGQGTLVLWYERSLQNSDGITPTLNASAVGKIAFFDWSRRLWLRRLTSENLCLSVTVVRVHDGALAKEYAVSSTTLVVFQL